MSTIGSHDTGPGQVPPSDDLRAGEYVLGVLDAGERRAAEERIGNDPGFARLVSDWEQRLSPWLAQVEPVQPSLHVWPRIRTRLGWPSLQGARPGLWNNAGFWRAATGLAIAAGVIAFVVGLRAPVAVMPAPPPAGQVAATGEAAARPVVVLARDNGSTGWLASIDAAHGKILMVPVPTALAAGGRANELWLIPPGEAPRSLGYVSNEKSHTVEVPAAIRSALAVGATLAITLEPEAGMPHAAPTGPIVAKGAIASI